MTVLVFDPAYGDYMQDLGLEIARIIDRPCEAILSSNAFALYATRITRNVYRPPDIADGATCNTGLTANDLVWGKECVDEFRPFYEKWLRDQFSIKQPSFCLFHNERFLWCALGIALCEEQGVPFVVLERGAFRPVTTSADCKGTNANSSFRRVPHDEVTQHVTIEPFRLDVNRKAHLSVLPKFAIFLVWVSLETLLRPSRRFLFHKKYSLVEYFGVGLGFIKCKVAKSQSSVSNLEGGKVLLVALQRPGDTQLTFAETYPGMQEMIDLVSSAINSLEDDWKVVLKTHPYDTEVYDSRGLNLVRSGSVSTLIDESTVVLTFNSTLGFEALLKDKPCVCLGESFFTKLEYVYKPLYLTASSVGEAIREAAEGGPRLSGDSIMLSVLNSYQIPGDFFRYDLLDIRHAAEMICERWYS